MLLLFAEILCVALVSVGAGLVYLPAGLIVGGLLGILACEWRSQQTRRQQ